jgi:hypothetical protein
VRAVYALPNDVRYLDWAADSSSNNSFALDIWGWGSSTTGGAEPTRFTLACGAGGSHSFRKTLEVIENKPAE